MNQFVISVMSRDRVGIIRDVASRIRRLEGNIADLSQTVLRGYFTMILLATFPDHVTSAAIQEQLRAIDPQPGPPLEIAILSGGPDTEQQQPVPPENIYVLTASGTDRLGFVAAVSTFCADNAINILDDDAASAIGIDIIGGYSANVEQGLTPTDHALIAAIPQALAETRRVCSSLNVGSTRYSINMDAIALLGRTVKDLAERSADTGGFAAAKFVVFTNQPGDNPFMAGAIHGLGQPEAVINVGVSGPGVVARALQRRLEQAGDTRLGRMTWPTRSNVPPFVSPGPGN